MKFILFFISILFSSSIYAQMETYTPSTTQYDFIQIGDAKYENQDYIMENYFKLHPDKQDLIKYVLPVVPKGYITEFEVKNDQLYIKNFTILIKKNESLVYENIIKEFIPDENKRKLDWYSGLLLFVSGKSKYDRLIHDYENNYLVKIEKGNITYSKNLTYEQIRKYKTDLFNNFSKTDKYKQLKKEGKQRGWSSELIETIYTNDIFNYYENLPLPNQ